MALGDQKKPFDVGTVTRAIQAITRSDEVKFQWVADRSAAELKEAASMQDASEKSQDAPGAEHIKSLEDKMKEIRKNCTRHEKKLFGGVINPGTHLLQSLRMVHEANIP
jgi:hypothetical protein